MRMSLRISKTRLQDDLTEPVRWYWFLEDMDGGVISQTSAPHDTPAQAKAEAVATHPTIEEIRMHTVL